MSKSGKRKVAATQTTGYSGAVDDKNRTGDPDPVRLIPLPAKALLFAVAARDFATRYEMSQCQKEKAFLDRKQRLQSMNRVGGGGQVSNAASDRYAAIMQNLEMERLEKRMQKYQKRMNRNKKFGMSIAGVTRGVGQVEAVKTRRDAMGGIRGSVDGVDRSDILNLHDTYDDYSLV